MSCVTRRILEIQQPKGGYIKPSEFEKIVIDDGISLNETENIHPTVVGLAVDYLSRFLLGSKIEDAFDISFNGARIAQNSGFKNAKKIAKELAKNIKANDEISIVNACKLVTFDVWKRNPIYAKNSKNYIDTTPDKSTIENIQIMVKRSLKFFDLYGDIISFGFTFEPIDKNIIPFENGCYGGYTYAVTSGDGDFLTADTLWDFKVSKTKPTSKNTLQLLMYWIMGQHSGQEKYKSIDKLGIYNPRLNTVYLLEMDKVNQETIEEVEREVICYE